MYVYTYIYTLFRFAASEGPAWPSSWSRSAIRRSAAIPSNELLCEHISKCGSTCYTMRQNVATHAHLKQTMVAIEGPAWPSSWSRAPSRCRPWRAPFCWGGGGITIIIIIISIIIISSSSSSTITITITISIYVSSCISIYISISMYITTGVTITTTITISDATVNICGAGRRPDAVHVGRPCSCDVSMYT